MFASEKCWLEDKFSKRVEIKQTLRGRSNYDWIKQQENKHNFNNNFNDNNNNNNNNDDNDNNDNIIFLFSRAFCSFQGGLTKQKPVVFDMCSWTPPWIKASWGLWLPQTSQCLVWPGKKNDVTFGRRSSTLLLGKDVVLVFVGKLMCIPWKWSTIKRNGGSFWKMINPPT